MKYSRNFGRAWSYVQLCQCVPLVCGTAISGIYYGTGNYVSVVSVVVSSIMLSVINVHKHKRDKRRRAARRQQHGQHSTAGHHHQEARHQHHAAGQQLSRHSNNGAGVGPGVSVPIRSAISYEVRMIALSSVYILNHPRVISAGLCSPQHPTHLHIAKLIG